MQTVVWVDSVCVPQHGVSLMPHPILVIDSPSGPGGLSSWVDRAPDLEVWRRVSTSENVLQSLAVAQPDLVLAHAATVGSGTNTWTAQIRAEHPTLPILAAAHPDEPYVVERALLAGAQGSVSRLASPEALLAAVRSVLAGHVVVPASVRDRLFPGGSRTPRSASVDALSTRQLEVLHLIGYGLSTTAIACRLGISPKTVETHRVHIKRRLGLETANALIRWAALWVESERS